MVETLCINWFSFEGHNPVNWAALLQSMEQLKRVTIRFDHESEAILGALKRPDSGKLSPS
ncbi:hypothetical protein EWM64_g8564 [Hericium alpestre]|uniref:Uncharacterized protein n=1 Tax=Hericium alpestre TaxID=135208 RepID=A0A4Y9ZN00_9AGAM|nr:hypothetical protein EWM64_g8564 [Hericium alpestre]